jgi:hypothetical protein
VGGGSIAAPPPLFQGRPAAALRRCRPIPPVLQKLHYHVDTGGASTTDRMEAHPGRGAGAMTSRRQQCAFPRRRGGDVLS